METVNKQYTCISCPLGCELHVTRDEKGNITVEGNNCKRGVTYAVSELTDPKRIITTTLRTNKGTLVPVRTQRPVPKSKTMECMEQMNSTIVFLPLEAGEVVIVDIADTGVDVIATRNAD